MSVTGPRDRLVAATVALIGERGVAGTGLSDLLKASGTARGSIYQHFPEGKDQLVGASVRAAGEQTRAAIAGLARLDEPGAVVRAVMEATRSAVLEEDFTRGCPVAAAAVAGAEYPAAASTAGEVFEAWVTELAGVLAALGVAEGAAEPLASLVVSAFEGALVQARATRSPAPLDHAADQLARLVEGAVAAPA